MIWSTMQKGLVFLSDNIWSLLHNTDNCFAVKLTSKTRRIFLINKMCLRDCNPSPTKMELNKLSKWQKQSIIYFQQHSRNIFISRHTSMQIPPLRQSTFYLTVRAGLYICVFMYPATHSSIFLGLNFFLFSRTS